MTNDNIEKYKSIKTQADAILHFLQTLDIEMIDTILSPEYTYQDLPKEIFIQKLRLALEKFIRSGDTYLNSYSGCCHARVCHFQCRGFSFIGNNSGNYFDLIIDIKDGTVHDIFECKLFKCETNGIKRGKRIYID